MTVTHRHVSRLPLERLITDPMYPAENLGEKRADEYLVGEMQRLLNKGSRVELLENGGGRLAIAHCDD